MALEQTKTPVSELVEGMYVAALDRPWHETPFPLQGFYIKTEQDIKVLSGFCRHVFIDNVKSRQPSSSTRHEEAPKRKTQEKSKATGRSVAQDTLELPPLVLKDPVHYSTTVPLHKEVSRVKRLHGQLKSAVRAACERAANGEHIDSEELEGLAVSMVVSVVRNPDALVWLSKMEDEDHHEYQHVVRAAVWALVFARHLGLSKPLMKTLAVGVLLSHVGIMSLPESLRNAPEELTGAELKAFQAYVNESVKAVRTADGLGEGVVNVVEFHAERHNGSGFPKGVTGEHIPLLAKIAGIVDAYQALITPRGSDAGLSPKAAVSELYEQRNILFQRDLVERFIEAIGIFPTGTLVELSNAEVGIVCSHNAERRLLPQVIVVTDASKEKLKSGRRVDLLEWNNSHRKDEALHIRDSLPKGAYDIDENSYLLTGATSKWSMKHLVSSFS